MFGIIADLIASATTILLPCYLSYKSLRLGDPAQTTPWLIYFIILTLTLLVESWTLFIIGWLPFYSWFRLIFLLYLVLPQTQGAKHLYLNYFEPWIVHHEQQIDDFIGQTHQRLEQMGLGYMNILVEWIREKILGQVSPQPHAAAASAVPPGTAGYVNYASDLLSRFAMPTARTSGPASTQGPGANVFSMLSSAAGAALGAGGAQSASTNTLRAVPPSAQMPPSPNPDSFLSSLSSMPADQKSTYISGQRDRLTAMLKALDREQQSVDLAYGADNLSRSSGRRPPSSSGGAFSKSRSEQSFENIDYDDIHSGSGSGVGSGYPSTHSTPPHLRHSSGWSTGIGQRPPSGGLGSRIGGSPRDDRDDYDRYDRDDLDVPRSYRDGRRSPRLGGVTHIPEEDYYLNRGYTSARDPSDTISRNTRDYDREYK